jgi:hypothetical protein
MHGFFFAKHPKESSSGAFCRLPSIRKKAPVELSVGRIRKTYQKAAKSELIRKRKNCNITL